MAIHLLNGSTGHAAVEMTVARLAKEFHADADVRPFDLNLPAVFDASRGQYHSTWLLKQMVDRYAGDGNGDGDKVLAVVDVDLFIPVLTFVFGEAQLGGRFGIVSTFRLRNQFYGLPANDAMLGDRTVKEAVHETGHLFGLVHCRSFDCVMRSSTYVEEIDLKPPTICPSCNSNVFPSM